MSMILFINDEHKAFYLAEANLEMNLGFKNGNWGDLDGGSVILQLRCFVSNSRLEPQAD